MVPDGRQTQAGEARFCAQGPRIVSALLGVRIDCPSEHDLPVQELARRRCTGQDVDGDRVGAEQTDCGAGVAPQVHAYRRPFGPLRATAKAIDAIAVGRQLLGTGEGHAF